MRSRYVAYMSSLFVNLYAPTRATNGTPAPHSMPATARSGRPLRRGLQSVAASGRIAPSRASSASDQAMGVGLGVLVGVGFRVGAGVGVGCGEAAATEGAGLGYGEGIGSNDASSDELGDAANSPTWLGDADVPAVPLDPQAVTRTIASSATGARRFDIREAPLTPGGISLHRDVRGGVSLRAPLVCWVR